MTPEEYQRVCEVLEQLLEFPDQQQRVLADIVHQEPTVHQEVISLLEYFGESRGLTGRSRLQDRELPSRLGPYQVVSKLGSGGMGVVYEAIQESPNRRVALKVIHPGIASEQALRRFQLEALVLARLQHPGIAQIYETGVFEASAEPASHDYQGLPYIVMEKVDGLPITEATGAFDLGPKLRLFEKVCRVVNYAHTRGIIHRDLKPANILVDTNREPRLLDFGIARVIEDDSGTSLTRTCGGLLMGTLPYMSPEQVSFDSPGVDIRSDVYALGVILFELLSGCHPYSVASASPSSKFPWPQLQGEPKRLGSVAPELRGDLEEIVAKALQRDPDHRYSSALDFADDVQRFLDQEPIRARPPSSLYRLRKFVVRNKLLTASLLTLMLGVLCGVVGLAWGMVTSQESLDALRDEKKLTDDAHLEFRREARKTTQMVQFLETLLMAPTPNVSKGEELTARQLLDRAAASIPKKFGDDPELAAWAHFRVGKSYTLLGEFEIAEPHAHECVRLYRQGVGPDHLSSLMADNFLAYIYLRTDRHQECLDLSRDCYQRGLKYHGIAEPEVGRALLNLSGALRKLDRFEESAEYAKEALRLHRDSVGEKHQRTLSAYHNVGVAYFDARQFDEAETHIRIAYEKCKEHLGEHHTQTLQTLFTLAKTLDHLKRYEEAAEYFETALAGQRKFAGGQHPETVLTLKNYFEHCTDRGKWEKARDLGVEYLAAVRQQSGADSKNALTTVNNLGVILMRLERYPEAYEALDDYVTRKRVLAPKGDLDTAHGIMNRAQTLYHMGRHDEARVQYREARQLMEPRVPAGHYIRAWYDFKEGTNLMALQRFVDAEPMLTSAYQTLLAKIGPQDARTVDVRETLRKLYLATERSALAQELPTETP